MAGSPRLNSITYAGLKVGEGTSYHLNGPHLIGEDYDTLRLSFDVVVQAATEAALKVLTDDLEDAYRTKNADLTVTINATNFVSLSHSSSTGFNSRATWQLGDTHRTNLSRSYECSVEVQLPADETGKNFRADSSNRTETDESGVRTMFVSARYTAGGGNTARENAEDANGLASLVTTILTELGGTWDATDSQVITVDDENKVAEISTSYRELIFNQSSGTLDNANTPLITYDLDISRQATRQLQGSSASPFTVATASFSSPVRKGQTQDLKGLVTGTILPYLETLVSAQLDGTASYVVGSERWGVNPVKNTIEGTVSYNVAESSLVQASINTRQRETSGDTYLPVADGKRFSRVKHSGPASRTRTVVIYTLETGQSPIEHDLFVERVITEANKAKFVLQEVEFAEEAIEIETQGAGDRIDLYEKASSLLFDYVELVQSQPSAGGGGSTTPTSRARERGKAIARGIQLGLNG